MRRASSSTAAGDGGTSLVIVLISSLVFRSYSAALIRQPFSSLIEPSLYAHWAVPKASLQLVGTRRLNHQALPFFQA
ncbi:hypothetical protein FZX09_06675 [Synechococcus sp. MU1643]|uniref:hypothetical protein n=1 Tax=Synechococcus sp. MU1643 TaxID=2508349 RepID=UPI001CF909E1|nr:hypothetical protein [Synechococcus sp. MU1643]MCB4428484.1 hypothetical protein [Synechococcus sp. MU1643]